MTNQKKKTPFERFIAPIFASRFFTVSALFHLVIVILIGGHVLIKRYTEPTAHFVGVSVPAEVVPTQVPAQQPPTLPVSPQVEPSTPPTAPASSSDFPALTFPTTSDSSFHVPMPAVQAPGIGMGLNSPGASLGDVNGLAPALPGPMTNRGPHCDKLGSVYGEGANAGPAVAKALQWLQTQQHTDGTWGSGAYHDAFTGLALLCYLGHGDTPQQSHDYRMVVASAIDALVAEGSAHHGRFASGQEDFAGNVAAYNHAICTYALCEAYTMTKDERLAPLVRQAVQYIIAGQRPDGGWTYSYDVGPDSGGSIKSDTSISGWQIQALKAAHMTGLAPIDKQVLPVIARGIKNMDRVFDEKSATFGYRTAGDNHPAMTGVGMLSKLFWLGRADRTVTAGFKTIEAKDLKYMGPDCNLYAWYYNTQAAFQAQNGHWDWWNQRFQDQLTNNQSRDGSWPPTGGNEIEAKWNSPTGDGPLYRTTLCCLMLEVYYRYLPTTQENSLSSDIQGL